MFKKLNKSTSTEVKYNAVSSIKNIAPEGTLQRLLFLNGGGPSKHKGINKKLSARRSLLILFLIFNIILLVSFSPIDS